MDQVKIGKFIAECRKSKNLTQIQLAEKLFITDRAVSKWENGKSLPDSSIMLQLCKVLGVSVNDLLNGEHLSQENYAQKMESQLLDLMQQKEQVEKRLERFSLIFFIITAVYYFFVLIIAYFSALNVFWYCFLGVVNLLLCFFAADLFIKLNRQTGHFKCSACGHTHTPSYLNYTFGNFRRKKTRLRCPNCRKRTWHQKIYHKES